MIRQISNARQTFTCRLTPGKLYLRLKYVICFLLCSHLHCIAWGFQCRITQILTDDTKCKYAIHRFSFDLENCPFRISLSTALFHEFYKQCPLPQFSGIPQLCVVVARTIIWAGGLFSFLVIPSVSVLATHYHFTRRSRLETLEGGVTIWLKFGFRPGTNRVSIPRGYVMGVCFRNYFRLSI